MNLPEAHAYLDSFANFEKISPTDKNFFQLEPLKDLLDRLDNPHKRLKCVHVVGSKGKGSTCVFAAYVLRRAGFKVGLYTSPHLSHETERIRILNPFPRENMRGPFEGQISDEELTSLVAQIKSAEEARVDHDSATSLRTKARGLTYFEVFTAMALLHFCQSEVDFVVLEAGLGGRLDATNVVESLICAVTPISLEHTQILGSTIDAIATEKAAIIKAEHQVAVIARQEESVRHVIDERCSQMGARSIWLDEDLRFQIRQATIEGQTFDVLTPGQRYRSLKTKLLGEHQVANATLAIGIVEGLQKFGVMIEEKAVFEGIKDAHWPGRFEVIGTGPLIVLDGAHNVASCCVLVETFRKIFGASPSQELNDGRRKCTLILSISQDKDIAGMCRQLNSIADTIILTKSQHPRSIELDTAEVRECFRGKPAFAVSNSQEALAMALMRATADDVILAAGSLFLVGEMRELCLK